MSPAGERPRDESGRIRTTGASTGRKTTRSCGLTCLRPPGSVDYAAGLKHRYGGLTSAAPRPEPGVAPRSSRRRGDPRRDGHLDGLRDPAGRGVRSRVQLGTPGL